MSKPKKRTHSAASPLSQLQSQIEGYVNHLREIEEVFNQHASEIRLGVRLDVERAISAALDGTNLGSIASFFNREDDSGVLHAAQLTTALDCIAKIAESPGQNGIVLGAMQSGKTSTALAMQFAGPSIYMLTGRKLYPICLATSHTGQQDQTNIELTNFLNYYSLLRIVRDEDAEVSQNISLDPLFLMSPTIDYYRSRVLRNALKDIHIGPRLDDFVARRVQGQSIREIADLCRRAQREGFETLLLIDEPQYGASDRIVTTDDGSHERRPCVMLQIFQAIENALDGQRNSHSFIGLSATPYDTHELESVWVVRQRLTSAYRGFNYFGGRYISNGVDVDPPDTLTFGEFARDFDLPFFANISLTAYDAPPSRFAAFAYRTGFPGTQRQYQVRVQETVKAAILIMVGEADSPIGVCLRLFNNNARAASFVGQLNLEREGIEVINYFGREYMGMSVKRAIRDRRHPDRPFVIVVTNKARMGDAFPKQVKWFVEFSKRASDLNSLLQGLLGRACGYNKESTVILSGDNAQIVRDYQATLGGYIYPTSRHSIVVGNYRRGAPTNLIRIRSDMDEPLIRKFFRRIQKEVVRGFVLQGRAKLSTTRDRSGFRTGPILKIAEEIGLFDYLERADVRERLFPTLSGSFRIARAGDSVPHGREPNRLLRYSLDEDGNCRFTFRWSDGRGAHVGLASRGYGARDATDRARAANNLEPQVHMEKYDPESGEIIFDKTAAPQRIGNWRAYMVTVPLLRPVRELRPGDASLPNERNVHRPLMTSEETALAGYTD